MPGSNFTIGNQVFNKMFLGDKLVYLNINDAPTPPSQSFSFREDEYSSSLVLALPGYQGYAVANQLDYGWVDVSADIRGTGVNYNVSTQSIGLYSSSSIGYFESYSGSTFVSGATLFASTQSLYSPFMATGSNFPIFTSSITVESWVNFTTDKPNKVLFDRYWPLSINTSELRFEITTVESTSSLGGLITSGRAQQGPIEVSYSSSQIEVLSGSWHHFALTKDGGTYRMYWDGNKVGEYVNANLQTINNSLITPTRAFGLQKLSSATLNNQSDLFFQDFKYYNGVAKYTGSSYTPPESMIITTPL